MTVLHDFAHNDVVAVLSPGSTTHDFEAALAALAAQNLRAVPNADLVALFVIERGAAVPDAHVRRQLAAVREARKARNIRSLLVAIVSTEAVFRGVVTAVSWLAPAPANEEVKVFATVDDAIAYAERIHGGDQSHLRAMVERARA